MKKRLSLIMDVKQKKPGFLILCMVLSIILITGATIAPENINSKPSVSVSYSKDHTDNSEISHLFSLMRQSYSNKLNDYSPMASYTKTEINSSSDQKNITQITDIMRVLKQTQQ